METATVTGTVTDKNSATDIYTATDKVVGTVIDLYIDTELEKDTNWAEGMFAGIATHTDTATGTVTETDMDKNIRGWGFGGFDPLPPGAVINSL